MRKRLLTTEGTDTAQSFTYGLSGSGMRASPSAPTASPSAAVIPPGRAGTDVPGRLRAASPGALDSHGATSTRVRRTRRSSLARRLAVPRGHAHRCSSIRARCSPPVDPRVVRPSRRSSIASSAARSPSRAARSSSRSASASLRYGSSLATRVADATTEGGNGTVRLGRRGRRRGHPAARRPRSLRRLPLQPRDGRRAPRARWSCARSTGHDARGGVEPPRRSIRMVNVSLEPGAAGLLEDLVRRHRRRRARRHRPELEHRRPPAYNFQFSCEIAWEIKRGKRNAHPPRSLLHGHHPAASGARGTPSRGATRLAPLGHLDLRQRRRSRAVDARRPRRRRRARFRNVTVRSLSREAEGPLARLTARSTRRGGRARGAPPAQSQSAVRALRRR